MKAAVEPCWLFAFALAMISLTSTVVTADWCEEQKLTAADAEAFDYFGVSVGVSGEVAVLGAPNEDDGGMDAGAVYLYHFDGATWSQEQKLIPDDAEDGDRFGVSVVIAGDTLIVGASQEDSAGPNSGAAYVYRFDGTRWLCQQKLTASDAEADERFGRSVAVARNIAVVGAPEEWPGSEPGAAYVYRFDGSSWIQQQKLAIGDAALENRFGWAVATNGEVVVVGAYAEDPGRLAQAGAAYVYRFDA